MHNIYIAKGLIQKQQVEIDMLKDRMNSHVARSMRSNVIISGLKESVGENCAGKAMNFFKDILEIRVERSEIHNAFRFGTRINISPSRCPCNVMMLWLTEYSRMLRTFMVKRMIVAGFTLCTDNYQTPGQKRKKRYVKK